MKQNLAAFDGLIRNRSSQMAT
ncbi:hypothetical protein EYZ11_003537 [Aspergillus tanneri]|uniref:Uncharacterized protein n=1 Tax=Aspergillus tanneri TaxID=1220188 RepID=A0A4S3JTF3_9EURO|nr:hypothetical protein EYZ11_003537 [Aspergillus tanneri]